MIKLLPHSEQAEQSVLGSCLLNTSALESVVNKLNPEDFYIDAHQSLWKAIKEMHIANEQVDFITISAYLQDQKSKSKKSNLFQYLGGAEFLTSLMNSVPSPSGVVHYANVVLKKSLRRKLILEGTRIAEKASDESFNETEILEEAEKYILSIRSNQQDKAPKPLSYSSDEVLSFVTNPESRGIPTGFSSLDNVIGGLRKGNVIIIGAQTSVGKTAFALNIAHNVTKMKIPAMFISLEMPRREIHTRLLSFESGINLGWLFSGMHGRSSDEYHELIVKSVAAIHKNPLYIDDNCRQSIYSIKSSARKLQREAGIQLLVVDFFQLISASKKGQTLNAEFTEISNELKSLAMELDIPVICCSQLNRNVSYRDDKRPQLSDLRESGAIEQGADIVIVIYREGYYKDSEDDGKAEIIVRKNRNGRSNVRLKFLFKKETTSFVAMESEGD